jgi:hypothetical protein
MKACTDCGHGAIHHNDRGCWCMVPKQGSTFSGCDCRRTRAAVLYDPPDDDDYEHLLRNVTI